VNSSILNGMTRDELNISSQYSSINRLVFSTDLVNSTELVTNLGRSILITTSPDGDTYINTAKILSRDHLTANGVFHVTDQ
jgi:hypothetical protein